MKFETIIELIQYRDSVEHNLRVTRLAIDRGVFDNKEDEDDHYRRLIGMRTEINRIDMLMSHILNTQYNDIHDNAYGGHLNINKDMFAGISADENHQSQLKLFKGEDDIVITKDYEIRDNTEQTECNKATIGIETKTNESTEIDTKASLLPQRIGEMEHKQVCCGSGECKKDAITRISIDTLTGTVLENGEPKITITADSIQHSTTDNTVKAETTTAANEIREVSERQEEFKSPIESKENNSTIRDAQCYTDAIKVRQVESAELKEIVNDCITKDRYTYDDDHARIEDRMFDIIHFVKCQEQYMSMVYATILFDVLPKLMETQAFDIYRSFLNETIFKSLINNNNPVLAFLQVRMVMPRLNEYEVAKIIRKSVFAELNPGNKMKYNDFLQSDIVPLFSSKSLLAKDARTLKFIEIVYGGGIDKHAKFQDIWMQIDLVPAEVRANLNSDSTTVDDKSNKVEYKAIEKTGII